MSTREQVLKRIDREELNGLVQQMVRIPSVTGEEKALPQFLAARWREMGLEGVELHEVIPGRFNVVGVVDSGSPGKTLVFNGHLDTVPVCQSWTLDPYGGEIRDGRMYGHGIGDQKAGIACQAIAALALKRSRIPYRGRVVVSGVIDHMAEQLGAKDLARRVTGDGCVISEPTNDRVVIAHRGRAYVDVRTLGRSAHTCEKHTAINAVEQMAKAVLALQKVEFHTKVEESVRELLGDTGFFSVGRIFAGLSPQEPHMIPDLCTIRMDSRTLPSTSDQDLIGAVCGALDPIAAEDRNFRYEVEITDRRDSFYTPATDPVVQCINKGFAFVHRRDATISGINWMGDSNVMNRVMPTVIFGPGGPPYYRADEYLPLDTLYNYARVYAVAACEFFGAPAE
jgi:acetylornithine deacetylase